MILYSSSQIHTHTSKSQMACMCETGNSFMTEQAWALCPSLYTLVWLYGLVTEDEASKSGKCFNQEEKKKMPQRSARSWRLTRHAGSHVSWLTWQAWPWIRAKRPLLLPHSSLCHQPFLQTTPLSSSSNIPLAPTLNTQVIDSDFCTMDVIYVEILIFPHKKRVCVHILSLYKSGPVKKGLVVISFSGSKQIYIDVPRNQS